MQEIPREKPEIDSEPASEELSQELQELALKSERQAIQSQLEQMFADKHAVMMYGQARLDEFRAGFDVPAEGEELKRCVAFLRKLTTTLGGYLANIETGDALLRHRALEIRDRVAGIYDQVLPDITDTYEGLKARGELQAPSNLRLRLDFSEDEFREYSGSDYNKHVLDRILAEKGVEHDPDDVYNAVSSLQHAKRDTNAINGVKTEMSGFHGHKILLFDSFESNFINSCAVPVGEYGEALSSRLGETVRRSALVLAASRESFKQAEGSLGEGTGEYFVRGRDNSPEDPASMLTYYEGMLTVQQTISQLTAQRIEGYEYRGDDQLIEDLVSSGIIEQMARIIPYTGIIGPMTLLGMSFDHLLTFEEGKFRLDRDAVKAMHEQRVQRRTGITAQGEDYIQSGNAKYASMNGCPAAIRDDGEPSSVSKMNELFLTIFKDSKPAEMHAS